LQRQLVVQRGLYQLFFLLFWQQQDGQVDIAALRLVDQKTGQALVVQMRALFVAGVVELAYRPWRVGIVAQADAGMGQADMKALQVSPEREMIAA
jgi:molybdate-binding protein